MAEWYTQGEKAENHFSLVAALNCVCNDHDACVQ